MKLSVIIPYHKTLEECKKLLDVLIPQLTNECELCIVDDDVNTTELDKYKADNINIIHHTMNSGCAGKPRNTGINNTTGEYIRFIDADDMIPPYFISKIIALIDKEHFDYSIDSWKAIGHPTIKEVIIRDMPPSWNTSIWNGTYKRSIIGGTRFSETKVVAEDEEFNKLVRKGKRANITDIMYYYNTNINDSITKRVSRGELGKELPIQASLLLYQKAISEIGGVEKFINEFCEEFHDIYDITLVYSVCDSRQLGNLRKLVKCIKFNDQQFACDKYICVSNQANIADNVYSRENWYADMVHADYTAMKWTYNSHKKTNVHIAVSEVARKSFLRQKPDEKCEVIYNLLKVQETKPVLHLITAARMDAKEKGYNRTKIFAEALNKKDIPFIWNVFTERPKDPIKGISYMATTLQIDSFIKDSDFYVSLSDTESWGYSTAQAMELGVPVVCTDYPAIHEQGLINGQNGYILDMDMGNVDEVIDKMVNDKLPMPKYKKMDSPKQWIDLLGKDMQHKSDYEYVKPEGFEVEVLKSTFYSVENITPRVGDVIVIKDEARLNMLIQNRYVKLL